MPTDKKIVEDEQVFAQKMAMYVEELRKQAEENPEKAKEDAVQALKETGVLDEDGETKNKIVSWE